MLDSKTTTSPHHQPLFRYTPLQAFKNANTSLVPHIHLITLRLCISVEVKLYFMKGDQRFSCA